MSGNTPGLAPSHSSTNLTSNVNRYLSLAHSTALAAGTGRSGSGCANHHYGASAQNLNDSVSTINHSLNSFSVYGASGVGGPGQGSGVGAGNNPSPVHINELKREMRKKE